ncbi:hypothetical protein GE21DRAFT_1292619 [Neurospora crassa]|nr:hypothetical protein GE21DRAFT_1292619 [Neurospora crassa]
MAIRSSGMTAVDSTQIPSSPSIRNLRTLIGQRSSMVGTLKCPRAEFVLAGL